MVCVNYFKLLSIIQVYIPSKYRELVKQRFKEETGSEWKNNVTYGNLIWDQLCSSDIDDQFFTQEEKLNIQTGSLDQFPINILSALLLHSKYKKFNKERIYKENNIIKDILDISNNKINNKINDQEYNIEKNQLIELLNQLLSGSGNGSGSDTITIIKDELEYLLDTLQEDNSKNINQLNKDSERIANEIKQTGDDYYLKENYEEAYKYYQYATNQNNLSNCTKSILYLNLTLASFKSTKSSATRIIKSKKNDKIIDLVLELYDPKNEDYNTLNETIITGMMAIKFRPSWSKPYYDIACIYSKMSYYILAIQFLNVSLALDQSEENSKLIKLKMDQINSKLSIIQQSKKSNGERDYEKEAKLMLYRNFQYLQIIKDQFKERLYLDSQYPDFIVRLKKYMINLGLPDDNKSLEFALVRFNYGNYSLIGSSVIMEYNNQLIGSGTEIAAPYYEHALKSNDPKFKMAMMIKASTLPVPFYQTKNKLAIPVFINYVVASSCEYLGKVYLHGLLDNDIDFERARYYFERAISIDKMLNDKELKQVECTGHSYFALGHMYYNGRFSPTRTASDSKSESKAIELWNQGAKINNGLVYQSLSSILNLPSSFTENITLEDSHIGFLDKFDLVQSFESAELIDLNQVRQLMDQGSPYSKKVFEIYTTISKFIQSFQQQQFNNAIDDGVELIKPFADIYCKLDMIDVIHLPVTLKYQLEQFIDRLLDDEYLLEVPDDQIVALAYIGFNFGFNVRNSKMINILLDISNNFASPPSPSSSTFPNQYEQALVYYQCYFGLFNKFKNVEGSFKLLLQYSSTDNNSFMFNYLLFTVLLFFKIYQESLSKDQIIKYYNQAIKYISTSIPKDHPILSIYHISITGVLSRLYGNNSTQQQQQQILSHYEQALESLNNLLEYRSFKKVHISTYLKILSSIPQFKNILSDTQINQIKTTIDQLDIFKEFNNKLSSKSNINK